LCHDKGKVVRGTWIVDLYSFFVFFATIREVLGVVMKYFFLLYPVAAGDGGVNRLELLIGANSRRFFSRHGKKTFGVQRFWRGLYQRNATAF
jgi:hypothetical protein